MKKLVFTMAILAFTVGMVARPVDLETAKQLGGKYMMTHHRATSAALTLVYTEKAENGMDICFVFNCQPKGFVIVAADDRMKPILGYSTESNFVGEIPDGLQTFFDNYRAGFAQMVANDDPQTDEALADWTSLEKTGRLADKHIRNAVEPLLSSIWNQTDLYNNMAPEDPTSVYSGHCKSGCVANAMSQVMRFWEWPRHGTGDHSYNASSYYGDYGMQYADFESATYRFELMPDYLDFASPQHEVDATALLESHAGVSVNMGYGPSASGAYSEDVGPALENYFRYSPDLFHMYENDDPYNWMGLLMENLDGDMPLYYASSGDNGGHAYVVDGYDEEEFFHLNWGWAGFDNGYFALDYFYLTFYSFPWWHNAVFNIHPDEEYYQAPMAVEGLEAASNDDNMVELNFRPVYTTRGGNATLIDTIVILRDGQRIASLTEVTDDQVRYEDQVEKNGTYYYTVYSVNEAGMSKVSRDTVMVGPTCDIRFELFDEGGNGWDMSSIAVLDEDGKVSRRVTLWDGDYASLVLPVPSNQIATFFWTYDNTCYSHGSLSEVVYGIFDWDGNQIVLSYDYPVVGPVVDYPINCVDGLSEEADVDKVLLYPNPASTCFMVDGEVKEVAVYDALGQLVYQGVTNYVEVDRWTDGVYFVRVVAANGSVATEKLVKRH